MKPNSNKLVCSQIPEKIIDLDEPANELRIAGISSGQNAEQLWIRSRKKLDLLYKENNQDKMCTIFGVNLFMNYPKCIKHQKSSILKGFLKHS